MILLKFLFWNLNEKNLEDVIVKICAEHNIELFSLCEHSKIDIHSLLNKLNTLGKEFVHLSKNIDEDKTYRTISFSLKKLNIATHTEQHMLSTHVIESVNRKIAYTSVHFESSTNEDKKALSMLLPLHNNTISEQLEMIGTTSSIIVGDFNVNPHDAGMISAIGFNSVMCPKIAKRKTRTYKSIDYPYYYNPLWSKLGSNSANVMGTYYYSSGQITQYWNAFDQVLISSDLVETFSYDSLSIIHSVDNVNLLTKSGLPNKKLYSDHLPIIFEINMEVKHV